MKTDKGLSMRLSSKLLSIVLFLISSIPLLAASPHAVIHGPTSGSSGDLIELDGSKSDGINFKWTVKNLTIPSKVWIRENDDQTKAIISNYPGCTYRVQLIVSNDDGIDTCEWFIEISGNTPIPVPPQPGPQPNPEPIPPNPQPVPPGPNPTPPNPTPPPKPPEPKPVPEGTFGIAPKIAAWANLIESTDKANEAKQLAEGLRTVQSQVAAGTLTNPRKILTEMLKVNKSTLGDKLIFWKKFGEKFASEIANLYRDGKLKDPKAWALLLLEIIIGLESIR